MLQISPLQEYFPTDWSGITTKEHLNAIYQTKPQMATDLVSMIYQTNFGMDLDSYLSKFPVLKLKTDDDFRWMLQGAVDKNIPLIGCSINGTAITAISRTGVGKTIFTLTFPEAYFAEMETIVGERNEDYQIKIVSGPTPNGSYYDYQCQLFGGDVSAFIPYDELTSGKRFSKEWAPVEQTLSKQGGGVNYTSPFSLRNTFTNIRMQVTHPGNMKNRPVAFSWVVNNGGKQEIKTTWLDYADWEYMQQFRLMKNRMLMFARSNKTDSGGYIDKGKTGHVIQQGAGLRQQMYSSNTFYYNTFSIQWLTDILMDISVGKLRNEQRNIALRTGEWGMYQFHLALEAHAKLYTPLFDQNRVYIKNGQLMGFRGQFLEYMGPNGIIVSLQHEPLYDDTVREKIQHSSGKGRASSYRYDVLNVGQIDGEYNVRKVVQEGFEEVWAYMPGLRDPFSPNGTNKGPKLCVDPTDGWSVHTMAGLGVMIKDPTKTVQILPAELR